MSTRPVHPARRLWPVLLLLLLALALRLLRLANQSLWYDEGVTAAISQRSLADLARWTADDIQPPLYYVIVAGWTRLVGASEWALRFPSAAAGLLTLPLLLALHRRLWRLVAGSVIPSALPLLLLAGCAPLWVYYAQEARNYTLLTALGVLFAYLLLRVLTTSASRPRRRLWLAAVLTAAAALYTHYFALFLLLALGIFYLLALWLQRRANLRPRLVEAALAGLATLLLYAPWLPFLLNRYRVDASYWQGPLKIGEALRHLAINITLGAPEMMLEPAAVAWLPAWGLIAAAALIGIGLLFGHRGNGRRAGLSVLFLLLYLLLPTLLILLLAWRTPKFNPRYLMLVTPAFYLLLGSGLSSLRTWRRGRGRPLAGLLLCLSLLLSAQAINNWFTDPAFAKADWRGVAGYVDSHSQTGETVILVSGHAFPVWDYYAPSRPPLRLPAFDVLDVNQVLGYDVATALQAQVAGRTGAWLVTWQDSVVDPAGFVADQLARVGAELPLDARFAQIGLRHFALPPRATFSAAPPLTVASDLTFGGQVRLLGWSQPAAASAPTSTLRLEWEAVQPLTADLKLAAEIVDDQGQVWGRVADRRLAVYDFPTVRWRPGAPVFAIMPLPLWPGAPPGVYDLRLRVYAEGQTTALEAFDAAGRAQGSDVRLTGLYAPALVTQGPAGPLAPADAVALPAPVRLAPDLSLGRAWVAPAAVEPGAPLTLALWWQVGAAPPAADYRLQVAWQAADGAIMPGATLDLAAGWASTAWPPQAQVLTLAAPSLPITVTAGAWALRLTLVGSNDSAAAVGDAATLPLTALPSTRRFDVPPLAIPVGADFDGALRLIGANLPAQPARPGQPWRVTLAWQALASPAADVGSFVQLLGADGLLRAQANRPPGDRPTRAWMPGEVVVTAYSLDLPADLPSGEYRVIAGLYDPDRPGLPRLRVQPGGQDVVDLARISLP
jgi:uncharacterized membrane protein